MGAHTPGPWRVVCTNTNAQNPNMGWWDVETDDGFIVAASLTLADATAVASFPDLLVALQRLLPTNINLDNANVADSAMLPCDVSLGELRAAKAALIKATGGAA